MNSSCVGWMCGGTKVPGGKVACQANESSDTSFDPYVWPRMCPTMPSTPVLALVMTAVSGCMAHELLKISSLASSVGSFNHEASAVETTPRGDKALPLATAYMSPHRGAT